MEVDVVYGLYLQVLVTQYLNYGAVALQVTADVVAKWDTHLHQDHTDKKH
tara:strand:- start:439 stop:588 length:150 start_codon:yes stop_codon:yes gene_type:complete